MGFCLDEHEQTLREMPVCMVAASARRRSFSKGITGIQRRVPSALQHSLAPPSSYVVEGERADAPLLGIPASFSGPLQDSGMSSPATLHDLQCLRQVPNSHGKLSRWICCTVGTCGRLQGFVQLICPSYMAS